MSCENCPRQPSKKPRFVPGIYKYYKLEAVSKNGELMYLIPITASVGQNK